MLADARYEPEEATATLARDGTYNDRGMPNLDDLDLRPAALDYDEPSDPAPEELWSATRRRPGGGKAVALVAVPLLAAGLVAAFWLMSRRVDPPPPGSASEEPAPEAAEIAAGEPAHATRLEAPLPPLDQSDSLVRELVGALSSHPALAGWLAQSGLVRTFAAAVENVSLGASPAPNLQFLRPREPYRVVEQGPGVVPDAANYRRYDLITEVFTSIDPAALGDVYRRLHGLVQEAFAELGHPDQSFESALAASIQTLIATPIPEHAPLLERHVSTYRYADPRLEDLAPAQKQLLRMGPDHARRIKGQLRRIAAELELGLD